MKKFITGFRFIVPVVMILSMIATAPMQVYAQSQQQNHNQQNQQHNNNGHDNDDHHDKNKKKDSHDDHHDNDNNHDKDDHKKDHDKDHDGHTPPTQPTEGSATIHAQKIVCDAEQYLPNWGNHDLVSSIDSGTAAAFLAIGDNDQHCRLADWMFEWAPSSAENPGDNELSGGAEWTAFSTGSPAVINLPVTDSYVWVREQAGSDYIPFSGATENLDSAEANTSAEIYCNIDVYNYDNYDRVDNMEADHDYYCVAWNVLKDVEGPSCDAQASSVVVSDSSTQVDSGDAVELTSIHSAWTADVDGADNDAQWIWATDPVQFPDSNDLTKIFTKTFSIVGAPTSGVLDIAADNTYIVKINGTAIGTADNTFGGAQTYDVLSALHTGSNTIEITVTNWVSSHGGFAQDASSNPAGLLYKLTIGNNECDDSNPTEEPQDPNPPVETDDCAADQHESEDGCVDNETPETPQAPALQKKKTTVGGSALNALPQVLGAESSCGIYVNKFLRKGYKNDPAAVKLVQQFLNEFMHAGIPVDGFFGAGTEAALKAFQASHKDKILDPWGIKAPTGIFYLTTQTEVNNIMCPDLALPIPTNLVNFTPSMIQ